MNGFDHVVHEYTMISLYAKYLYLLMRAMFLYLYKERECVCTIRYRIQGSFLFSIEGQLNVYAFFFFLYKR
ncbi:hypothetical protein AB4K20DRAFT_1273518 [Rhizopus microsporus]